jgi:hypothetical protein
MIDIDLIRGKYSRMTDEELIFLANTDGNEITHEAFIVLKREFKKRNLQFDNLENQRIAFKKQKIVDNLENESQLISDKLWNHVFELSYVGESNEVIYHFLVEEGLPPESAQKVIESLEKVVEKIIAKIERYITVCKISFIGGFLLFFVNYYSYISFQLYVVGIILSIKAAISWADNEKQKNKFRKILSNIQEA